MRRRTTVMMLAVLLLAGCRGGTASPPTAVPATATVLVADCRWSGTGRAWVDSNGNGLQDGDEPPLAGVRFLIDDTRSGYADVGAAAVSNQEGTAELLVWLPACPRAEFEVYAEPPAGYALTTQPRLSATDQTSGKTFLFGFAENP